MACDGKHRVPAPRWEGRWVKAGAAAQEPLCSGMKYGCICMVYVSFWYAALFLHILLLQVHASFTLLILEMLVWDKSACTISCFLYLMLSNDVQTNPSPLSLGGEDSSNEASVGFGHIPACLRRRPPH